MRGVPTTIFTDSLSLSRPREITDVASSKKIQRTCLHDLSLLLYCSVQYSTVYRTTGQDLRPITGGSSVRQRTDYGQSPGGGLGSMTPRTFWSTNLQPRFQNPKTRFGGHCWSATRNANPFQTAVGQTPRAHFKQRDIIMST